MRQPAQWRRDQRGAVAVVAALCMVVLVGFLGFVIDLGHLYVRKTELQNAADAAALAGARALDGSPGGIGSAVSEAMRIARLNGSDYGGSPVAITEAHIRFGPSPGSVTLTKAEAEAVPKSIWFVKVDTSAFSDANQALGQGTRPTWFIKVLSPTLGETTAHVLAVAGRTVCEEIPVFACVLDATDPVSFGYKLGQSYLMTEKTDANDAIGPGNIGWLDPVSPDGKGVVLGAKEMQEVLCRGQGLCMSPGTYTSRTQNAFHPMADALNTRFGEFKGSLNKDEYKSGALACPVDSNVKEYKWEDTSPGGGTECKGGAAGCPAEWMDTNPTEQSEDSGGAPGVHWAAVVPTSPLPNPAWAVSDSYPDDGKTPYTSAPGSIFHESPASPADFVIQSGRRVVTLGIATNCGSGEIKGSGKPVVIEKFGRFLLQRHAMGGSDKGFYGEFMGMVDSATTFRPGIKLYR